MKNDISFNRQMAKQGPTLKSESGFELNNGLDGQFGVDRSASQIDLDGSQLPDVLDFADLNGTHNNSKLSTNGKDSLDCNEIDEGEQDNDIMSDYEQGNCKFLYNLYQNFILFLFCLI